MSLPVFAVSLTFAALLAAILYALVRAWRIGMHDGGRLRLAEVLERRGMRLDADPLDMSAAALAARRCVYCASKDECDAWLAAGRGEGLARFCPNAEFVAHRADR